MTPAFHIPIINYHKISQQSDIGITSRKPDDFARDLALLYRWGFRTVTFKDLILNSPLPERPIVLTFDDGYKSIVENALPALQQYGYVAVIYMPTDYIDKTNDWDVQFGGRKFAHLSRDDLRQLNDQGFEIGSHGCSHRSLLAMNDVQAMHELAESKKKLEAILNRPVYSISYPFGQFNRKLLQMAKECGYAFGVASLYYFKARSLNGFAPFALRRLNIYRMDSAAVFEEKVRKGTRSAFAYRDWLIQKGSSATVIWQKWFRK